MLNFLPPTAERSLSAEYAWRRAALALFFASALFTAAAFSLVPPFLLAVEKEEALREQIAAFAESTTGEEMAQREKDARFLRSRLGVLSSRAVSAPFASLLQAVAQARGEGISLMNLSFHREEQAAVAVAIGGEAENRAALVAFEKALGGLRAFDSVELPVGNLAKDAQISFSLSARREPLQP